jgi:hypothetical protein
MSSKLVIVEIGPELAGDILASSRRTKETSQPEVDVYIERMRAGEWDPWKQDTPVMLNDYGLMDGYHRMTAIVQSGLTMKVMVRDHRTDRSQQFAGERLDLRDFNRAKAKVPSAKPGAAA